MLRSVYYLPNQKHHVKQIKSPRKNYSIDTVKRQWYLLGMKNVKTSGDTMKNYLSFGGGVNSVALYLLMQDLGMDFEAVFVNHGGDWPETYEYVDYFINTGRPLAILRPEVRSRDGRVFNNIIEYFEHLKVLPTKNKKRKFCTQKFKSALLDQYQQAPCFVHIGYAADEASRAAIGSKDGREYRWLLIEHNINRDDCIALIVKHGLRIPKKSGCYFCPFQKIADYKNLRATHPDLFCRVEKLEKAQNGRIRRDGVPWKPYFLAGKHPLAEAVRNDYPMLPGIEARQYPPCQCGL